MKKIVAALAASLAFGITSTAEAHHQTSTGTLRTLAHAVAHARTDTWRCQNSLGIPRTRASVAVWALPASIRYRRWVVGKWRAHAVLCTQTLHRNDAVLRTLRAGLADTEMAGTERELEAAARRHRISPYFIAGIAGTESSFGDAACSNNRYNAFGLSSCGSGWHVPNFQSWAEAYDFMGGFLRGRWANARTTYDFHGYAACSSCWGAKTAQHMANRFGVGSSISYP